MTRFARIIFASLAFFSAVLFLFSCMYQIQERRVRFPVLSMEELAHRDFTGAAADDPNLVAYIKHYMLEPPSEEPYNLTRYNVSDYSQYGQTTKWKSIFQGKRNGFFVEVGAYDGEHLSNTLSLEIDFNWSGLLIEANAEVYSALKLKRRKAHTINTCLSLLPVSTSVNFSQLGARGHVNGSKNSVKMQCYPLYSLMLALERNHIDVFSLDIEGAELKVLKTIPWDKLHITLVDVEVNQLPEGRQAVVDYMASVGYSFLVRVKIDYLFVRDDLLKELQEKEGYQT